MKRVSDDTPEAPAYFATCLVQVAVDIDSAEKSTIFSGIWSPGGETMHDNEKLTCRKLLSNRRGDKLCRHRNC